MASFKLSLINELHTGPADLPSVVLRPACFFFVVLTIQEITQPAEKLGGYTRALITAHASGQHIWACPVWDLSI